MPAFLRWWLCLTGILFLSAHTYAQTLQPYILNGSATQRTCNCYVLTEEVDNASGTVWNKNKINLSQSFNYVFDINLGCKDESGADGIGFILQTQGTNLGSSGQGLGFKGISPSLGVLIDTWHNANENDPAFDHIAIQMNGISDHLDATGNLTPALQVIDGKDNIEDCNWHLLRINWNASTHLLEVSVDNEVRFSITKDLVNDIFHGDPMVYWGFAGSTGGSSNLQQFCAALRPDFAFSSGQILCDGTPVSFSDNSSSFGVITRRWWDLGDGTTSTAIQPPPHLYAGPGSYEVKMVIEDNSGCISDTLRSPVTIGSYPVVDFGPEEFCITGSPLKIGDSSRVDVGTKARWEWDFGNGAVSSAQNATIPYTAPGRYNVELEVTTREGCSTTGSKTIDMFQTPLTAAAGRNACIGEPVELEGSNLTPGVSIAHWYWALGNGDTARTRQVSYTYAAGGSYTARLHAVSTDGCPTAAVETDVEVVDLQLHAGSDTVVAKGQPLQLNARATGSNLQYTWMPSTGMDNPYIANPVAYLQKDQEYHVTVTSPEGCRDEDVIAVKAYTGPEFYVPNAFTPNNDGRNDLFRVTAAGIPKLDFLRVWDRWGKIIFQTADVSTAWDGTFNGQPAGPGTYVWMVQGVDYLGRRFSRQGTVTLIR
ncbi:lectin-like domain-containing protein [Chitinophaga cymbidii]|uniref:PKD domain-containing protein n=1 Tax=Chitinophaga cymbidii TaxID=1096750 RepID=A0A512RNF9_9BACT|nr:PKD domain-containing protein [Chitinophaga cymbidii]GEP97230.1 hypothetical protein CCY01nite_34900 [Chitinophaga cymbidii]